MEMLTHLQSEQQILRNYQPDWILHRTMDSNRYENCYLSRYTSRVICEGEMPKEQFHTKVNSQVRKPRNGYNYFNSRCLWWNCSKKS